MIQAFIPTIVTSNEHIKLLETALTSIATWLSNHGFRISLFKSKFVIFGRQHSKMLPPPLLLNQKPIPYTNLVQVLGLLFHSNHSWIHHIRYIEAKSLKMLNVLRCLAHPHSGSKRNRLILLYQTLIRSIIDYGSPRSIAWLQNHKIHYWTPSKTPLSESILVPSVQTPN